MLNWVFSHKNPSAGSANLDKFHSMKKFLWLLTVLSPVFLYGQTVDEVIRKYADAMGGLDAYNKIETAKITGTLISQGNNLPLTTHIVNGKQMRTDVNLNGQVVTNAYDKGKGWKINAFEGINTATEVTAPDDLAALKVQTSLANNLMDYKKRGHQVELLGQEDVEGVKTNKIRLTNKDDGKQTVYYINVSDNMLVRSDTKQKIQGDEYDAQTYYSGLKDVNGIKFSMHFVRKIQGRVFQEVQYEKVELNVPVDEKIFKQPQ